MIHKTLDICRRVYQHIQMTDLEELARAIASHRRQRGLTQDALARKARVSRPLIAKLETGRYPEVGVKKLLRILHAVGLDLRITALNLKRPTLEDLAAEDEGQTT
jgi:transcriptional regulator with XRE-family HTH domain